MRVKDLAEIASGLPRERALLPHRASCGAIKIDCGIKKWHY